MRIRAALFAAVLASTAMLAAEPQLSSGLDVDSVDTSVRPQDDLFRFVNGRWLASVEIPADRVVQGTFAEMLDRTELALKAIVEEAASAPRRRGSRQQQIGDLYRSFMDERGIDTLGSAPIQAELGRIDAIRTASEFATEAGHLGAIYTSGPFGTSVSVDANDSEGLIVQISQGGTRLPSRDYYLSLEPAFVEARTEYEAYLTTVFTLIGRPDAAAAARQVMVLETALARAHLTPLESRDALRTVRRTTLAELATTMPGFDWRAWARPQGIDRAAHIVLLQPAFFRYFSTLVPVMSIDTWKAWLAARFVFQATPYLSRPFVDARFNVFGRLLAGQPELGPRWKAGVSIANSYLGDAMGQLYVERHFTTRAKTRAERIVTNVARAFRQLLTETTWLTKATRNESLAKLVRLTPRVGFPDRWRDYSGLVIRADDLVGNWQRAMAYANTDRISRIRGANDPGGWVVNTQAINAYYTPATNEIVLTAAMLQPPLFNADAEDAVNYGALGAMVGHEISHAFDERGRRFDADGNLRTWWTPGEEQEYQRRARGLVESFSAFTSVDGQHVNGELTLPENLADLVGLSVAYRAYLLSLDGEAAPVIDGFTGPQRFFMGYARMWRGKMRESYQRQWLLTFPYAPEEFRTNGIVSHVPGFYEAFGVAGGDGLFRAPAERVGLW